MPTHRKLSYVRLEIGRESKDSRLRIAGPVIARVVAVALTILTDKTVRALSPPTKDKRVTGGPKTGAKVTM